MIARRAKFQSVTEERIVGGALVHRARVTCDGIDSQITLTTAEHEWADRALASGAPLVISITEEPIS